MGLEFFWRLPVDGDGRSPRQDRRHRGDHGGLKAHQHEFARTGLGRDRFTWYDHLVQIARAAELTGFAGVDIPQTDAGEEPLVVAGALARESRRIRFVPAIPAPLLSAVYAAKIAISFQRLTGGRLAWRFVAAAPNPGAWHGQNWPVAEQIAWTDEFLDVARGVWHQRPFTYRGRYHEVENGGFGASLSGPSFPAVYLSGDSAEALALSAKHADVHVLTLATPDEIRERIASLNALAAERGRTLRYALEADVIARHSDEAAWDHVRALLAEAGAPDLIPAGKVEILNVRASLWSGFDLFRPALVGGHVGIADRLAEYAGLGIEQFILSANPSLEEAYRLGEQLLPLVRARVAGAERRAV